MTSKTQPGNRLFCLNISLLLAFLMLVASCSSTKPTQPKPKALISQATLTQVLVGVHIIEAAMNMRRNNGQEFEKQKNALFDSLFVHYAITPQILEENMLYFNQQPKLMEKVYEDVIDSLMKLQKNLRIEEQVDR